MNLHLSIESLLPSKDSTFQIKDIFPFGKLVKDYVMPYRSPLENILLPTATAASTATTPTTITASSPSSTQDSNVFDQKTEILRQVTNKEEERERERNGRLLLNPIFLNCQSNPNPSQIYD